MPPQPNMQQLLKQAQKMQEEMLVNSITINPEAVDPEDVELLQDMVLAAINEGMRAAQELASAKLGGIAGGLGGLGLPGF